LLCAHTPQSLRLARVCVSRSPTRSRADNPALEQTKSSSPSATGTAALPSTATWSRSSCSLDKREFARLQAFKGEPRQRPHSHPSPRRAGAGSSQEPGGIVPAIDEYIDAVLQAKDRSGGCRAGHHSL
jgi:hypothetical protein